MKSKTLRYLSLLGLLVVVVLSGTVNVGCQRNSNSDTPDTPGKTPQAEIPVVVQPPAAQEPVVTPPVAGTIPVQAPQGDMLEISYMVRSMNIADADQTILVEAKCVVPEISNHEAHEGIEAINQYFAASQQSFLEWVTENAEEFAREDRAALSSGDYTFRPHVYERWPEVHYNDNGVFSVLNIEYFNTGGAHPNTFLLADNFLVETGRKLQLTDLLGMDMNDALEELFSVALTHIESAKNDDVFPYFDDYEELVRDLFNSDDVLVSAEKLVFFYQPYTLAPYAGGIPQFSMEYSDRPAGAIPLVPIANNEEERELYLSAGHLLDRNRDIFANIYMLSMLPMQTPVVIKMGEGEQRHFPVTDERFPNLAALEGYLRATYGPAQVDALLGEKKYIDIDGRLHGDIFKDGGMGYYTDWTKYRFSLNAITADTAQLTAVAWGIYPGGDSPEEETFTVKLLKLDGYWVMERMIY